jgi:DNA-directed RNA polymerase specialized sigma subunit
MIKTEKEYKAMVLRLREDLQFIDHQKGLLEKAGLSDEEINRAMEPTIAFHEQLKEEVEYYEKIKRFEFGAIFNLSELGRTLIGLRIAIGMSQAQLAESLGVSEAQVSRDEKNEYHGISVERAHRILEALNITLVSTVERLPSKIA